MIKYTLTICNIACCATNWIKVIRKPNTCPSLQRVILPSSITTIGESAFKSCTALKDINLSHITQVGNAAFQGTALTEVSLDAARSIGGLAFGGCAALTKASMPLATTLESSLFANCYALKKIILTAENFVAVTEYINSNNEHIHPFTHIPTPADVTLTLNASQQDNDIIKEEDGKTKWRPLTSDGNSALVSSDSSGSFSPKGYVDLSGFKEIKFVN